MRMKEGHIGTLTLLSLLLLSGLAFAAENDDPTEEGEKVEKTKSTVVKVVVTATKLETPARQVGSSVTVITGEEIEKMQKTSVVDVLRTAPALDVNQSGAPGAAASILIRGAKSEHTLVIIDGVEMNDPTTPGRTFNFSHLSVDNIERIEILRGPQSTLYGSDAIGGVINIITRKGMGKPSGFASIEGGSYGSYRGSAGASGGNDWMNYAVGFSHSNTDGISAASENVGNTERDGYKNTTIYGKFGLTPTGNSDLDFTLRFIDAVSNDDLGAGAGNDDPNNVTMSQQLMFRTQGRLYLLDEIWEQKLGFSLTDHDLYSRNDIDEINPDIYSLSSYDGQVIKIDWQNNFYIHDSNTMTFGMETEEDKGESDYYSEMYGYVTDEPFAEKTARTTAYYLQDQFKLWNAWFTTVGVRLDDHSRFGTQTTYRIASAYLIQRTDTKIKGSFGTGFKAPTLLQLYSRWGNEDLTPEESTGWDFGLEQSMFKDRAEAGATYFHSEIDNLINFAGGRYSNVGRALIKGIELFGSVRPVEQLDIRFSYTHTNTKDIATAEALTRRADNKFNFDLDYGFLGKGNIHLGIAYVGGRYDVVYDPITWESVRVRLDGYVTVDPAFSYQISDSVQVFFRVDNLFNREYEAISGYGTPGISAYGGLKFNIKGM